MENLISFVSFFVIHFLHLKGAIFHELDAQVIKPLSRIVARSLPPISPCLHHACKLCIAYLTILQRFSRLKAVHHYQRQEYYWLPTHTKQNLASHETQVQSTMNMQTLFKAYKSASIPLGKHIGLRGLPMLEANSGQPWYTRTEDKNRRPWICVLWTKPTEHTWIAKRTSNQPCLYPLHSWCRALTQYHQDLGHHSRLA